MQRRVCCTDQSDYQDEGGTLSVRTRVCSANLSHHQYDGEYAVQTSHIISKDESVQQELPRILLVVALMNQGK